MTMVSKTSLLTIPLLTVLASAQAPAPSEPAAKQAALIFSPNGDGVKDQVTFKLGVPESASVSSWLLDIRESGAAGEQGAQIKEFSGKGRPPKELKWDGKDLSDRIVRDGTYLFSLSLVTPAGNQVAIVPSPLIVDRVPPLAQAWVEPALFSPNGDGNKDETQFTLQGEDPNGVHGWLLVLKDKEGAPARSLRGKGAPPAVLKWDGRGDFEEDVPDGAYAFELTVDDLAGNRTTTQPQPVTINRAGLVSTVEVVPILFSPNGDGVKDQVSFRINSGDPESVERWELKVLNQNGKVVHRFTGVKDPPGRIQWNGLLDDKKTLADGSYQLVLSETDHAGNTAQSTPQPMELDTAPPIVETRLEPALLSPNGDGNQDEGAFHMKAEDTHPLERWTLKILNDVGKAVKTISGPTGSKPTAKSLWRGLGEDGQILPDGVYGYVLEAADIAGNRSATPKQTVRIDRVPPLLSVAADPPLFSPNGDGILDTVAFKVGVQDAGPLEKWSLALSDAKGKVVRTFTGLPEAVPPKILWDGKNEDRAPLPDGPYSYVLKAKDIAGNHAATPEQKVTLGATQPAPQVTADLRAISPNADAVKDLATFKLQAPSFNALREWSFRILDKSKGVRRTIQGRGDVPGSLQWQGERDDQRPLPDDEYSYELEVADVAGNKVTATGQTIRIDTVKPQISVQVSPALFSPNGDGVKDEAVFVPAYKDASPIAKWRLVLQDTSRNNVYSFSGTTDLPLSLPWKGKSQEGAALPDGSYTFIFYAEDEVGNKSSTPEQLLRIDDTPPTVALQADPQLFSPNGDGNKDETNLMLDYKDASDIAEWSLGIVQNDLVSRTFKGVGRPPRSFPWDGKNDREQPVLDGVHKAVLTVTDEVGNTGKSVPLPLTVDNSKPLITVTAETDDLEDLSLPMSVSENKDKDIVISLATEVLFDTGQAVIKPQAFTTLMKANHLVRRYPQRKVRIEGHADTVPIHNEQFKNNLELSRARAKSVMAFFTGKGKLDPERVSAEGFGDKRPRASNGTEEGRRANRRVEIILVKEGKQL